MADIFETAHCEVALGGDINNTVVKYDMTAGEIAVLQIIHGKDAVTSIEPSGTVRRSNRVEKARLTAIYGRAADRNGNSLLEKLYPGAAARIFQRLDELELSGSQFKPGLAPEGIDEADAAEQKAINEGSLLADGSVDEDAANGLDEPEADDQADDQADEPAAAPTTAPSAKSAPASVLS